MLNKENTRELAYLARVTDIAPMNAERLECVYINGWTCVCGKGEFKVGDIGVFFEPDAKLPDQAPFNQMEFLKKKDFKIKPQKIRGVISQGLFMPLSAFYTDNSVPCWIVDGESKFNAGENVFLTERLGVTYAVFEDNQRKASSSDKYKKMAQRHPNIFRTKFARWIMQFSWGRKLMFFFFGKKKDKKNDWPSWVVKTDEERCQNMPWLFPGNDEEWIATEKVDGTSTTFTMKGFGRKRKFYTCSRNVVFDKPNKKCFYETNVYTEMAEKYRIEDILNYFLDAIHEVVDDVEFITIQGETYGGTIQRRDYSTFKHEFRVFNIIYGYKDGRTVRLNPVEGKKIAENMGLKYVPVVDEHFKIPATCDEILKLAHGNSEIDGGLREGLVIRSLDGAKSFKVVDPEYLLKYHN